MPAEAIKVEGLREFSRALRRLDSSLPKALRLASNEAAAVVVADAKPKVPTGPAKGGHAVNSVKAASTRTAARVQGGGKRYPYYPWLDFGGGVGPRKSSKRPYLKTGRYIWKSYADNQEKVAAKLVDALQRVVVDARLVD
jgi:hypothetical protein